MTFGEGQRSDRERGPKLADNFWWGKTRTSLRRRSQKGQHSMCGQTVDKKPTQTRANAHFFSYMHHSALTAHFQCGNPTLAQGEKEFMSCLPLHSLPSRLTCRCWTSRSLVFLKSYPHQLVLLLKPLRLLLRSVAVENNPCASARWSRMSGRVAHPTENKGNEPNFYSNLNEEHTPINFLDSFPCRDDATVISAAEDPEVPYSGASSSSKRTAASSHHVWIFWCKSLETAA